VSIPAQILKICAASAVLTAALSLARGLPAPEPPPAGAGAVACSPGGADQAHEIQWISPDQAHVLFDRGEAAFVDCRSEEDFASGHVSGSLHAPAEQPDPVGEPLLSTLRAAATVITYCDADADCDRSARVAARIASAGLPDVRVLEGGMPAWLEGGYPAESGTCDTCGERLP
jgi:rhodanese-related sulfurtransferase